MLAILLLAQVAPPPAAAPAKNPAPIVIALKGEYIAAQIDQVFQGAQIDLASDRRSHGVVEKGGQVRFGPALKNEHIEFSVPSEKVDMGWFGAITYRLRDVHLKSCEATATPNEYLLIGHFDGKGPQIVGSHSSLGSVLPGVYMQNIQVMIWITPTVDSQGRLTYTNTHTRFTSKMNTQGLSFTVYGHHVDLLDSVTGYHQRLADLIAARLRDTLEDPARKASLTDYLNKALQEKAAKLNSRVKSVQVQGTDLKLTLEPK